MFDPFAENQHGNPGFGMHIMRIAKMGSKSAHFNCDGLTQKRKRVTDERG